METKRQSSFRKACLVGLLVLLSHTALGQKWVGQAVNGNWSNRTNWLNGLPLNDGSANVVFSGTNQLAAIADVDWSLRSLTFASQAGSFALDGRRLTLGAGGITDNSLNPQLILNDIRLAANQTWSANSGFLEVRGAVDNAGYSLTFNGNSILEISGSITGLGDLVKAGKGTLVLSGENSFSGGLTLLDGTLVLRDESSAGLGSFTLRGGSLETLQDHVTFDNAILFEGNVTLKSDGGILLAGPVTLRGNRTISVDSGELTLTSLLGQTGGPGHSLTKEGAGRLIINGPSAFSGSVTVNGGTLVAAGPDALNQATAIFVNPNSLFELVGTGGGGLISDQTELVLNGGTLVANNATETFARLTLGANSTILLSPDGTVSALTFGSLDTRGGQLTISGWNASEDQIIFDYQQSAAALSAVSFVGYGQGAMQLPSGEIMPVPEPTTISMALLAILGFGFNFRCRRSAGR